MRRGKHYLYVKEALHTYTLRSPLIFLARSIAVGFLLLVLSIKWQFRCKVHENIAARVSAIPLGLEIIGCIVRDQYRDEHN